MLDRHVTNIVAMKRHVIIDQTNMTSEVRQARLKVASPEYIKICVDVKGIPVEQCVQRVNMRVSPIRRVPRQIIRELDESYQAPSISEGFDHIFILVGHV